MRKRTAAVLCILAALLSGALVWLVRPEKPAATATFAAPEPTPDPQSDPLEEFLLEREQLRGMHSAQLNDIIYGENTDEETRALAQRTLLSLLSWAEQETTIKGILRARGYADCAVTVHEDTANVLVRAEALTREESAVILELVLRETDVESGNVKIIPIN